MKQAPLWLLLITLSVSLSSISCTSAEVTIITDPVFSQIKDLEGDHVGKALERIMTDQGGRVKIHTVPSSRISQFTPELWVELTSQVGSSPTGSVLVSPMVSSLIADMMRDRYESFEEALLGVNAGVWIFWNIPKELFLARRERFPRIIIIQPDIAETWNHIGCEIGRNGLRLGFITILGDSYIGEQTSACESGYTNTTGIVPRSIPIPENASLPEIRRACKTLLESGGDVIPVYAGERRLDILLVMQEFPTLKGVSENISLLQEYTGSLYCSIDWEYASAYHTALVSSGTSESDIEIVVHTPAIVWY